jgi:hypothetical protein
MGHTGVALYVLGVGLHTIQDFASHKGMTNTEHSYLSYDVPPDPNQNPDLDFQNFSSALEYSVDFLSKVHVAIGDEAWKKLLAFTSLAKGETLPGKLQYVTIGPIKLD